MGKYSMHNIPNIISIIRIIMVFPIAVFIWQESYNTAFILMIIAGLSDGLDGFLARAFHWQSKLGAILDPVADKLLLVSIFVVCGLKGFLPWWLVLMIIGRDLIIIIGAFAYRHVTHDDKIKPLLISKINTALQILLAIVTLYQAAIHKLADYVIPSLIWLVAISTFISGMAYVILWTRYTLNYQQQ